MPKRGDRVKASQGKANEIYHLTESQTMGQILSSPVIDKEVRSGTDEFTSYAVSSMQGWRVSMEDSHIVNLNVCNGTAMEQHVACLLYTSRCV